MARRLAPSILNADLARLADEVAAMAGVADWIHIDLMDGHFVPNLTFGPPVVAALRRSSDAFFDCHLMVSNPEALLPGLAEARADSATMHLEALDDPARALAAARDAGLGTGLALKPATPLSAALPYLDLIDVLLVMTVEPGFGGQAFRNDQLPKVRAGRSAIDGRSRTVALEVDGGVGPETLGRCIEAGADTFVVGSAIFAQEDPGEVAKTIQEQIRRLGDAADQRRCPA